MGQQEVRKYSLIYHILLGSSTRIQPCRDTYIGLQYGYFGCNTDQLHLCMIVDKWLHLERCNRVLHPFGCGVAIWCFCNAHKKLTQPRYGCKYGYCDEQHRCVISLLRRNMCCNIQYCHELYACYMAILPQTIWLPYGNIATPLLRGNINILQQSMLRCNKNCCNEMHLVAIASIAMHNIWLH